MIRWALAGLAFVGLCCAHEPITTKLTWTREISRIVYPTGESEVLLRVPRYDFNWQLSYYLEKPLVVTKGTRIECTAHFDNSANNAANPNPKEEVRWGDQSWEEMMIGWFDLAFDPAMKPDTFLKEKKPAAPRSDD